MGDRGARGRRPVRRRRPELCALIQLGAALVQQGRREEGTTLLDEAMAAALAGEARRPHTVVYASCNLVTSCAQTAELAHALQWIHAADAFEQRFGNQHLYTTCRRSSLRRPAPMSR